MQLERPVSVDSNTPEISLRCSAISQQTNACNKHIITPKVKQTIGGLHLTWSSQYGSESHALEVIGCKWCYALLLVQARNDDDVSIPQWTCKIGQINKRQDLRESHSWTLHMLDCWYIMFQQTAESHNVWIMTNQLKSLKRWLVTLTSLAMLSSRAPTSDVIGSASCWNDSATIATILGRFALFSPNTTGWFLQLTNSTSANALSMFMFIIN